MAEWSAGFYSSFDTLIKVAKDKFPDVALASLKEEDYAFQADSEVGMSTGEKMGLAQAEDVFEEGASSRSNVLALPATGDCRSILGIHRSSRSNAFGNQREANKGVSYLAARGGYSGNFGC